ncbi:MAG: LysR family transcriptional regulator [Pirellulaceae bacterium]|nr:LysR family transcriptional regulator [Pirellulaceae bacterium]
MHVKSLKVFCDVVGRRSFSLAASENGMSQSGASQIVHQLEDSLGVRLIDRSKRPFVLTAEGEVYYEGCRKLVHRYSALVDEVRTLHQYVAGRVNVASIYSVGLSYGKELIDRFTEQFPKTTVHIEYHHPDRVYELVAEGQVDIGLVSYAQSNRSIGAIRWREEPMILVCSPDHPLAARRRITAAEVDGLRVIGFDRGLPIRRNIDRQLAEFGIEVAVDIAFDNVDTIKRAIVVNTGASFLPAPSVQSELLAGEIVSVEIENVLLTRPLGIIHRRGVELGQTAQRFIELLTGPACSSNDLPGAPPRASVQEAAEDNGNQEIERVTA